MRKVYKIQIINNRLSLNVTVPDGMYNVIVEDSRTLRMNDTLHGWIRILADELGYEFEEMLYIVKCKFFGSKECEIEGCAITLPIETSKMPKKDFALSLTAMEAWALTELEIKLPRTEELTNYFKTFNFN